MLSGRLWVWIFAEADDKSADGTECEDYHPHANSAQNHEDSNGWAVAHASADNVFYECNAGSGAEQRERPCQALGKAAWRQNHLKDKYTGDDGNQYVQGL